ncbi:hypothetical protein CERZMDRAFT_92743 [Cercospora zeae-maydis SCOH1-5]|uniref:Uncharacterized protein n=1 Tax=Cercospora zeae-maydis SCOH1-5 TaxID=717836 RepID=A0A6A6FTY7_9PEZI|nr:hypothetical protein CERZMDRAFT_92743 [Cercospora zeae-maydis SCOH1-5]
MDHALAVVVSSPRRRRTTTEGGDVWALQRTGSQHSSSTSSDILVAGPASQQSQQSQQQRHQPPSTPVRMSRSNTSTLTRAYTQYGHLTIRFAPRAARDRLRAILLAKPQPDFASSNDDDDDDDDDVESDHRFEQPRRDARDDVEGPNERGTYSKQYTLKHPEIKWVHRGQGRYLPASEIKPEPEPGDWSGWPEPLPAYNAFAPNLESPLEAMLHQLWAYFDRWRQRHKDADSRPGWSPQLRASHNTALGLFRTTPRHHWSRAIEDIHPPEHREVLRRWVNDMERKFPLQSTSESENARPSRLAARQAKTVGYSNSDQRRSSRLVDTIVNTYDESEDDVDVDQDDDDDHDHDVEEAEESEPEHDPDQTYSRDYVDAHPHESFYHTGAGRYRRGSRATIQSKQSTRRGSNTSHVIKYSSSEASHDISGDMAVKKEDLHKHAGRIFHHRGNQFYRPGVSPHGIKGTKLVLANGELLGLHDLDKKDAEDLLAKASKKNFGLADPRTGSGLGQNRSIGRRKSNAYSAVEPPATTTTTTSGRRTSKAENHANGDSHELSLSRTTSRRFSSKSNLDVNDAFARDNKLKPTRSKSDPDMLLDKDYVDAHPDEIFHHRGQGKWARGLPPPGSSNKMAVRGPGAREMFDAMQRGEEIDGNGKPPPPITALLRKEEGPDLYPQYQWHYRGGGKHCRLTKEEAEAYEASLRPTKRQRLSTGTRGRGEGPEAQLQRESLAAQQGTGKGKANAHMRRPGRVSRNVSRYGLQSKASSNSESKAPTPKPPPLAPEDDRLTEDDLPSLYKDEWSDIDEQDPDDEAAHIMRARFRPIVGAEPFIAALTKYDPAVRSLDSLKALAANAQMALMSLQDEYLELDKVVARHPMNGKKERKPVHGGRDPVSHAIWEDKKEAALYDYAFDARKIGYQDPDAQRIVRDAEGRELRRRRNRIDPHSTQVNYGDGEMTTRRTIKPVSRFDGVVVTMPRKRSRLNVAESTETDHSTGKAGSTTPERMSIPAWHGDPNDYVPPTRGRWAGHVPKRIQELRGTSVSRRSESNSPAPSLAPSSSGGVRKGRPPGSKNREERKDKGIKKGPRKKKTDPISDGLLTAGGSGAATPAGDNSKTPDAPQPAVAATASGGSPMESRPIKNPMSLDSIIG